MTLEDFFTLTEMKDGLSTLGRVEELVSLMEKQRDCALSNVGDAARQWSTVGGTLAVTVNKDCLNHFVQLNGLCFLNQWLQEAQKCNKVVSDDTLEGLITALLASLERLPVGREKSIFSGIRVTVQHLLTHENSEIKEKAQFLFSKWNNLRVGDVSCNDLENIGMIMNDEPKPLDDAARTEVSVCSIYPVCDILPIKGETSEASSKVEAKYSSGSRRSESSLVDNTTNDIKLSVSNQNMPTTPSNCDGADVLSVPDQVNLTVEIGSASICDTPVRNVQDDANDHQDICVFKEAFAGAEVIEGVNPKEGNTCKSSEQEATNASSSSLSASLPAKTSVVSVVDPTCNFTSEGGESCMSKVKEPQLEGFQDGCIVGEISGSDPSGGEVGMKVSIGVDILIQNDLSEAVMAKSVGSIDQNSEVGSDYEEIDALELARQVALEVEREVVDYREPFCSSPEVNSGEMVIVGSPKCKQDQSVVEEICGNRSPNREHLLEVALSPSEHKSLILENINIDAGGSEKILESDKAIAIDHDSVGKCGKRKCEFDLNEDVCTEEYDFLTNPIPNIPFNNLSAPVAVVASSKGAPGLPVTPLHFEGEMGWKGSAATSAFRPASPRRTSDCEKNCSSPKRKSNFLGFDLNVAESEHDIPVDSSSMKQVPISYILPLEDSLAETSSRTAKKFKLDLNCIGDDEITTPPQSSYWQLHHNNGDQNASSPSSSSSRQPSIRDFDLNDNPSFLDLESSHYLVKSSSKPDDPTVRITGSRRAGERNDYVNQAHHQSLRVNGHQTEATMAAREAMPYAHMPTHYMYNGHLVGPAMPIHQPLYGHVRIPYVIDSRGAAVVPQVLGSVGSSDVASNLNGVGPLRFGLDLNSSMMGSMEGSWSREAGSFQQIARGQNVSEERARISLQPYSSVKESKRKQTDCGWESYSPG